MNGRQIDPTPGFQAVYQEAAVYDRLLLPHYYDGVEDVDLVAQLMVSHYGQPGGGQDLRVVDFGCGTGRVTAALAPYARHLIGVDASPSMIEAFRDGYPAADARCLDTRAAVTRMLDDGLGGTFDVVGAFWSLNYPLGECFEEMTVDGIRSAPGLAAARRRAARLVGDLRLLLSPGGHLLVLFFDSETREQRLVTRLWERIAPFPQGGRAYTRSLLLKELHAADDRGEGRLTHTCKNGIAVAPHHLDAHAWFTAVHLKGFPRLVENPQVHAEIRSFVDTHSQPSGQVRIPTRVHVIDYHASRRPVADACGGERR